jgi:hypothetical protein
VYALSLVQESSGLQQGAVGHVPSYPQITIPPQRAKAGAVCLSSEQDAERAVGPAVCSGDADSLLAGGRAGGLWPAVLLSCLLTCGCLGLTEPCGKPWSCCGDLAEGGVVALPACHPRVGLPEGGEAAVAAAGDGRGEAPKRPDSTGWGDGRGKLALPALLLCLLLDSLALGGPAWLKPAMAGVFVDLLLDSLALRGDFLASLATGVVAWLKPATPEATVVLFLVELESLALGGVAWLKPEMGLSFFLVAEPGLFLPGVGVVE